MLHRRGSLVAPASPCAVTSAISHAGRTRVALRATLLDKERSFRDDPSPATEAIDALGFSPAPPSRAKARTNIDAATRAAPPASTTPGEVGFTSQLRSWRQPCRVEARTLAEARKLGSARSPCSRAALLGSRTMEEVASTFASVGLTPSMLLGAKEVYQFIQERLTGLIEADSMDSLIQGLTAQR